jgi:Skp family chaperone for outer membrane proteins
MSIISRSCSALAAWALLTTIANAAGPAAPGLGGPTVPGVCLLSQEAVLANSKVGLAATERLRQLAQAAQGDLETERSAIESDAKALEAQKASLSATQLEQRRLALAQRAQALQAKVQERSRQVEATRAKAIGRIAQDAQPVIAQAYRAQGCGLLFSRDAVLGGNMTGDLTPAVVQGLDAKITTIDFDLEPAPAALASR